MMQFKMRTKKFLSVIVYSLIFFLGTITLIEVTVRVMGAIRAEDIIDNRIKNHWNNFTYETKKSYFFPPHLAFVNSNFDDDQRLEFIAQKTLLPKNKQWQTKAFLRNPKEDSTFTVTSNSFGCRGKNYSKKKARDTIRILTIGSYAAFGMGVNDNETYSAELEKILNHNDNGKTYEVWNCGRQGATAIMGLALLKRRFADIDYDMLLVDYGHVDMFTVRDTRVKEQNNNLENRRLKLKNGLYDFLNFFLNKVRFLYISRILRKQIQRLLHEQKLNNWKAVSQEMVKIAQIRKVPLIFIYHLAEHVRPNSYLSMLNSEKNIYFFDSWSQAWMLDKPTESQFKAFNQSENWTQELEIPEEKVMSDSFIYYRGDAFFPNHNGYAVIAKYLAKKIQSVL